MDFFMQQKHPSKFFPIIEPEFSTPSATKKLGIESFSQGDKIKQKRKSLSCSLKRKKPCFKLPKLIVDDPLLDDDVRDSFKRAFFAKGFTYATDLVYNSDDCP